MSTVLENGTREHFRRRWAAIFTRLVGAGLEAKAVRKAGRFVNPALFAELAQALHSWEELGENRGYAPPLAGLTPEELALRDAAVGYAAVRRWADAATQWAALAGLMNCCVALSPRRRPEAQHS